MGADVSARRRQCAAALAGVGAMKAMRRGGETVVFCAGSQLIFKAEAKDGVKL